MMWPMHYELDYRTFEDGTIGFTASVDFGDGEVIAVPPDPQPWINAFHRGLDLLTEAGVVDQSVVE